MLDDPATKTEGRRSGTTGAFYIIKPGDKPEILTHIALDGRCFGSPAYNGKVYMQTTRHLYCFGKKGNNPGLAAGTDARKMACCPARLSLANHPFGSTVRPGQTASFRVRSLDANGFTVEEIEDAKSVKWASFIPPTARVKSTMKAAFNAEGNLVAAE